MRKSIHPRLDQKTHGYKRWSPNQHRISSRHQNVKILNDRRSFKGGARPFIRRWLAEVGVQTQSDYGSRLHVWSVQLGRAAFHPDALS
jgi:hypothetical protein